MHVFSRANLLIAAAGLVGAASLIAMPMTALVPPELRGELDGLHPLVFLVQPAVLVMAAALAGGFFAPRVRLGAPLFAAVAAGRPAASRLRGILFDGLLAGFLGALILWAYEILTPNLSADVPLLTRLLYGGVAEEVIARWGVMSVVVWLAARIAGLNVAAYVVGAAVAALVFALGHLPLLFTIMPDAGGGFVAFVIAANFVLGLGYGLIFWRRGLEAAMVAHAATHAFAALFAAVA